MSKTFNTTLKAIPIALLLGLSGCMVGPDYQKPATALPESWRAIPDSSAQTIEKQWWRSFNDPVLEQLISKVINSNLDIKLGETRISEARAARATAKSSLLPTGDMMANANRQQNQLGFPSGGPANMSSLVKQPFNIFKAGFDASWELDLFGGHRRAAESAKAESEASTVLRTDILISTLAEVARTYVSIRQYQAQLTIALDIIASDKKTMTITRQRFDGGNTAGIDVSRAEAQLEQDQAQLPYFSNLLTQAEYSMDILLGERPGMTHVLVKTATPVPVTDKKLILAAPAIVIAHRPDIRNAERMLAAATAQQGVAVAKFFPDISLTGFIGLFNTNAGNFLNVSSKSWSMGGNVLWPILSYGSLSANLNVADAKQQEAMISYQKSILGALSDVERSFTAYTEQEKYLRSLEKSTAADHHICTIANERYQAGLTSFLDVLDAKRTLYASQNQLALAQAQTAQNVIAVYKSLGGSWKPKEIAGADAKRH